jgi:hypothetical protein
MKAKLKFDLLDLDQRKEHLRCIKATDMAFALSNIFNLKKKIEYRLEYEDLDSESLLDLVFVEINNIINHYNLNIEELKS